MTSQNPGSVDVVELESANSLGTLPEIEFRHDEAADTVVGLEFSPFVPVGQEYVVAAVSIRATSSPI